VLLDPTTTTPAHDQDAIFVSEEADAFYRRNVETYAAYDPSTDQVLKSLLHTGFRPQRILDYGCATGDRLAVMCATFGADGVGIEPSPEAVVEAQRRYPDLGWLVGTIDAHAELPAASFDLVVCTGVMSWVDRRHLLSSLAAIDHHVADHGAVLFADFVPDYPQKRRYHHRQDVEMYTWKLDFTQVLTATGLYREVFRHDMNYLHDLVPALPGERHSRWSVVLVERLAVADVPEV
jgi:SAM-dependent methyltransferase